jgi:HD-GYP domain-containing protein (c-di-GMP phosphodiesterase class II)
MKKFVSVNELSFGVYVTQLDRPWTETPFVFQGFLLNSEAQLATLHKFCKSVCIDTEKGADVKSTPAGSGTFTVLQSIRQKVTYEEKIEVNVELPAAREAHIKTTAVLTDVFGSIQSGKALDAPRIQGAVTSMTESVVRNPDAMLLLARMKEKDAKTLDRAMSVSIYMITFGRFLSLPREQLHVLGLLGLLQDVGKLRLPRLT